MKSILPQVIVPAILSTILTLPFMVMEWINGGQNHENFAYPLFIMLWMVSLSFFLILIQLIRQLRTAKKSRTNFTGFIIGVPALVLLAWFWGMVVVDQMPCFLGLPNCD